MRLFRVNLVRIGFVASRPLSPRWRRLIASHREPMVAMLRCQPILDRLFVQEAGHVVDLASWTVALDLPTASGRMLSFENYMSVYHRARLRRW